MSSPNKLGDIFAAAGTAFQNLGELTKQLTSNAETLTGKWTDTEIEMLWDVVKKFEGGLNDLSNRIKLRRVSQVRKALKKKALEDGSNHVKKNSSVQSQPCATMSSQVPLIKQEVTLNMLNASQSEVDAENLHQQVQLQFNSTSEVATK
ncbi:hypothetical protein FQA39_LY14504 [Lamprigera yunnana]|nr:hypothetical protein FQA39_LY14504 [Lamprigera yunnana]